MRYASIAMMASDEDLRGRLVACAADEEKDAWPDSWVAQRIWRIVTSPGWPEAWESAIAAEVERPGWSDLVISDPMILGVIQPMDAPVVEEPEPGPEEPPVEE